MITHLDNMLGQPADDLLDHVPEYGGPITKVAGGPGNGYNFVIPSGVQPAGTTQATYQYAANLSNEAIRVTWTIEIGTNDATRNIGFVIAPNSGFATYLEVTWNAATQILTLDNNGIATTYTTTFAANSSHTLQLTIRDFTTGGRQADLFVDGVNVLTANPVTVTGSLLLFLRGWAALPGNTDTTLVSFVADNLANIPAKATAYLNPSLGVFCQYTPASGSDLSALRFEYAARAIVLKGALADIAVTWVDANTPPELIFAP